MSFAAQRYRVSRDNAVFGRPRLSVKDNCQYDRFIPCRSAMDMDIAHYMLTNPNKGKENVAVVSPKKEAYRKTLEECVFGNRTRILSFKSKPQTPVDPFFRLSPTKKSSVHHDKPVKKPRHIPKIPKRMLDAPFLVDDYYLNLLDWGSDNTLAIALGHTVYLWNGVTSAVSQLPDFDEGTGHVTSVSWAQNGRQIAVGLDNSDVQLWDTTSGRLLRTLKSTHSSRVGSLSWNNHLLTTGCMDGRIVNNDVRIRSHVVQTYSGHTDEVCGLKWSASGNKLASGGGDSLVHIWDVSMASTRPPPNQHQWLHRLDNHTAAVKALAWSPFQSNLLASGGGEMDQCIKFWNASTGACVNSVDTGSQVTALLWNTKEEELLSSHGYSNNQLTLWKYPSMDRVTELTGHTSRVLSMAQSPDGCTVASLGGDETLRIWQVFGTPEVAKLVKPRVSHTSGPMSMHSHIR